MKGTFVRVQCSKCKETQTIFGRASTKVRCQKCNSVLAIPSGGRAKMRSKVEEVLKEGG
jgi:small subunit ribosomal protein S27e